MRWSDDETEFLKQNLNLSDKELAEKMDRTVYSIKWKRKKEGWLRTREDIWSEEDIQELLENQDKSAKYMGKKLGKSRKSIYAKRYKLGMTNNENGINVKYTMNMDFFKIWSDEMAYVLGFIYADGWISENKYGYVLGIACTDEKLIQKINTALSSTYPVRKRQGTKKPMYSISINRKEIVEDVQNLGIVKRKSLVMKFPNIPKKYFWHFVRGYFDGDGSVRNNNRGGLHITIYSGSKDFIESLSNELKKQNVDLRLTYGTEKRSVHEITIRINGKEYFCNKMYENATIYLERKYNIIKDYYESRYLTCVDCGEKFRKRSSSHKRCDVCAPIFKKKRKSEYGKIWWSENKSRYKKS